LGSLVFLLLPLFLIILFLYQSNYLLVSFFIGGLLSDYILTIITALSQRRKEYLYIGLLFPFVRFIDAVAFLSAIPRALLVKSSGRWVSPSRRR
jgi:poly-beta-1,6-N-acetyl-D-glucosamine synthase